MQRLIFNCFGCLGYIINTLPLLITLMLCFFIFPPISFVKVFVFLSIFEAINNGLAKTTSFYIRTYKPYTSTRSIIENKILMGGSTLKERFSLAICRIVENLFDGVHYLSCAIVAGIVMLVNHFI